MNKFLLLGAATAALICAGPAFADPSASNAISISGSSPDTCTLDPGTQSAATNATFTPGAGASTLAIGTLASATDATLQTTSATITFVGMCNYAHNIGLQSANSGLQNGTAGNDPVAGSGSFIKKVGYTASYVWAGHTSTGTERLVFANDVGIGAGASAVLKKSDNVTVAGANQGNLVLHFDIASSSTPVVSGSYSDTLTVKIGATL